MTKRLGRRFVRFIVLPHLLRQIGWIRKKTKSKQMEWEE